MKKRDTHVDDPLGDEDEAATRSDDMPDELAWLNNHGDSPEDTDAVMAKYIKKAGFTRAQSAPGPALGFCNIVKQVVQKPKSGAAMEASSQASEQKQMLEKEKHKILRKLATISVDDEKGKASLNAQLKKCRIEASKAHDNYVISLQTWKHEQSKGWEKHANTWLNHAKTVVISEEAQEVLLDLCTHCDYRWATFLIEKVPGASRKYQVMVDNLGTSECGWFTMAQSLAYTNSGRFALFDPNYIVHDEGATPFFALRWIPEGDDSETEGRLVEQGWQKVKDFFKAQLQDSLLPADCLGPLMTAEQLDIVWEGREQLFMDVD